MKRQIALASLAFISLAPLWPLEASQTKVKSGRNIFSVEDDIKFGRQAAAEVENKMPMVNDPLVQEWISGLGRRLVAQTSMPNLPWRFRVTNSNEVNAFALPGGFVYVNRGLLEITETESEVAGVLGHEISHVVLRHGTSQLSKALFAQFPLAVLGSLGGIGRIVSQIGGAGISVAFLKFSRDAEKDADILGTQIMVRAGYDPRGMVRLFEKLNRISGGRRPQFLSDHPNPENRIKRIEQEISMLQLPPNPIESTPMYAQVRSRFRSMSPASSRSPYRRAETRAGEPPSRSFQTFRSQSGLFELSYPSNWDAYPQTADNVILAPGWATDGNQITHGAMVSLFYTDRRRISLDEALDLIISQLAETNPNLREESGARYKGRLAGREAVATFLSGRNNLGLDERLWLIARPVTSGIIYILFVAPERDFEQYQPTFQQMIRSLTFRDW
jgi:hypothetical protein